jgi:hypothetical protein
MDTERRDAAMVAGRAGATVGASGRDGRDAAVAAQREIMLTAVAAHVATGGDPWTFTMDHTLPTDSHSRDDVDGHAPLQRKTLLMRAARDGDAERLVAFGRHGLGEASRSTFAP